MGKVKENVIFQNYGFSKEIESIFAKIHKSLSNDMNVPRNCVLSLLTADKWSKVYLHQVSGFGW